MLRVGHDGYERLSEPVRVTRIVTLDTVNHALLVVDDVDGSGERDLFARFTLPPHSTIELDGEAAMIRTAGGTFDVRWTGWTGRAGSGWFSPSYGVKLEAPTLELQTRATGGGLSVAIAPAGALPDGWRA